MKYLPRLTLFTLGIAGMLMASCSQSPSSENFDEKADWAVESFDAPVMTKEELEEALSEDFPGDFLLVDTRAENEFSLSHLPGAVNWADYKKGPLPEAVERHAREGNPVIFYCSIGYRSGEAALRAQELLELDAKVYNLRGGIFQWANEDEPIEGSDLVHGYDQTWEKYLRKDLRAPLE